MLPTPSTSHVRFDNIYEPAEDSFLLLDTISSASETAWLQSRLTGPKNLCPLIAEVGVGSGVVVAFVVAHARAILGRTDVLALGIDVNMNACAAAAETVTTATLPQADDTSPSVYLGSICSDLTSSILNEAVDVLIFNPPYVPTPNLPALPDLGTQVGASFEADSRLLSLAYAGGVEGVEQTYRLLKALPLILSQRGMAYVLLCAQNKPGEVKKFVECTLKMHVQTIGSSGKVAGWEKLKILRIWR